MATIDAGVSLTLFLKKKRKKEKEGLNLEERYVRDGGCGEELRGHGHCLREVTAAAAASTYTKSAQDLASS